MERKKESSHRISRTHLPLSLSFSTEPRCAFPEFLAALQSQWICSPLFAVAANQSSAFTPKNIQPIATEHGNDPLRHTHSHLSTSHLEHLVKVVQGYQTVCVSACVR